MAEQGVTGKLDFEDLRRAQEQRDLDAMLDLYAEDAEIHIVNRNTPPSSPYVLPTLRQAIANPGYRKPPAIY